MNKSQLERMHSGKGFIAALDQSGGSTPKTLAQYGLLLPENTPKEDLFDHVHEMRTRVITSPSFSSEYILGAILFENTMDRQIEGRYSGDYLWEVKGIVPFLKVDLGLEAMADGVKLMKPITGLGELLKRAKERHIFGTKMRSVIMEANPTGIANIVTQQFDVAKEIAAAGLVPIIEPEVDIHCPDKTQAEIILKDEIHRHLSRLPAGVQVMFKLTLPDETNFYEDLTHESHTVRVVALSGGYSREVANEKLAQNKGVIASFSRALLQDLRINQTKAEFDKTLLEAVKSIYEASVT